MRESSPGPASRQGRGWRSSRDLLYGRSGRAAGLQGRLDHTGRPKSNVVPQGNVTRPSAASPASQPGINQTGRKPTPMDSRPKFLPCAALAACALLAGCSGNADPGPPIDRDPAMLAALAEPLMTDPDLSQSNARNLVAEPAGPSDRSLPALDFASNEAGLAREEAAALTGARLRLPGLLAKPSSRLAAAQVPSLAGRARLMVDAGACADRMGHEFAWGALMGDALPVYPRAHLVEGAGLRDGACDVRAVTFLTPVAPQPLMAFYHAEARAAGYADAASISGDAALLEGAKGGKRFAVLLRNAGHGVTSVDLILREK